ncbi:hypothetical protein [Caproicibacter fermentans]|uniref:Uncharacterized protein n=1 Tax=Caproicibacter fermentans TaxID=2576756 RepID=A0A7G8T7B6_9FIRM|nr:hypothetical protein [Caproicibacter fermentans]QNK39507.1 hypothetical protein HCR03_12210 [Caproicibacter fermentans]
MLQHFSLETRRFFLCNLLLVVCCSFYLLWWLLAFRPVNPIKGMKTGWLLIPAFAAGITAVVFAARGLGMAADKPGLIPSGWVLRGGIAAYVLLLIVTRFSLHRPVTTELFLIVGWAMLALNETSVLFGCGAFGRGTAMAFSALIAVGAAASLVCYVLYYQLPAKAGFIDGIVPLATTALIMGGMDLALLPALG